MVKSPLWEQSTGALVALLNSSTFVSANLYTLSFSASDEFRPQHLARAEQISRFVSGNSGGVSWSPDSTTIAYVTHFGPVLTQRYDGQGPIEILSDEYIVFDLSYSPDGTQIAFTGEHGVDSGIFTMNADGTSPTLVVSGNYGSIDWGSNNKFAVTDASAFNIYSMNPDGSGSTVVTATSGGQFADGGRWSPDATQIAYNLWPGSPDFGFPHINIINANGSGNTELLAYPDGFTGRPAWSPNAEKIIFTANEDSANPLSGQGLWFMTPTGGDPHKFLNTLAKEPHEVHISPDGSRVAYFVAFKQGEGANDAATTDQADCGLWTFKFPFVVSLRETLLIST